MTGAWLLVVSPLAAAAALLALRRFAGLLPQDHPNERSLHRAPTPRAGGLSIWIGFLPAAWLMPPPLPVSRSAWLVGALVVAAVSFADDIRGVPATIRLAVHAAVAAAVAVAMLGGASPLVTALAATAIVWSSNLFNFMDGSDGLAASAAIIGFAAYALAAAIAGGDGVAYAALALACAPFFVANLPPASMFMGDVGAVPLGFLAGAFGIGGIVGGVWPSWFPLLVFLPFLADATVTLALRGLRGERVWQAHRSHYYQKLNTLGAGHRGTLSIYAAAMLACATLAVACVVFSPAAGIAALAAAFAAHLTAFALIDYHWRKQSARSR